MSFHAVRRTKHKRTDRKGREERMKINGRQVLGVMHKTYIICRYFVSVEGNNDSDTKLSCDDKTDF